MRWLPTWEQFKDWSLPSKYTFLGFVLGAVSSGISVYFAVRPSPELVLLANALRAEKPTNLVLTSVQADYYAGIDKKLVFIDLKNASNRPAYKLQANFIGPVSVVISRPQETSLKLYLATNITIPGEGSLRFPIAYENNIAAALRVKCISGFSTSPNVDLANSSAVGFALHVKFTTVFNDIKEPLLGVYAIVPEQCN